MTKPMTDAAARKLVKRGFERFEDAYVAIEELLNARYPDDVETRDALVAAHRALRHLRLRVESPDGTE